MFCVFFLGPLIKKKSNENHPTSTLGRSPLMTGNIRSHAAPGTHPQKTDKAYKRFVDILSWENTPNISGGGGDLLMTEAGRETSEGFRGPATALIRSSTPTFLYSAI